MKNIFFHELYEYNYSVEVLNALKQHWDTYNSFSCIGTPKKKNMLLYLSNCSAEYTLKSGEKFFAKSGDVVFTPINFEYSVLFFNLNPESYTIGVNFFIYDNQGTPFVPDNRIRIFSGIDSSVEEYFALLEKTSCAALSSPALMKSALYEILTNISLSLRNKRLMNYKYSIIADGIKYLENDENQLMPIKDIADMCNVSEVYFRRLFTEYSGISPIKFRISKKIEKAKLLLKYDNLSINEISDRLGFITPAYFTKKFKSIVGKTPSEYRKK